MANRKNILCVVGSRNQTTQLHEIAKFLEDDYNVYYSQLFGEGILYRAAAEIGFFDNTVLGRDSSFTRSSQEYIRMHNLNYDYRGTTKGITYDLALLSTDMIVPKSFKKIKTVWIQEGMIDPINKFAKLVNRLGLPPYTTASTALNGTTNIADLYFAMSQGYKEYFTTYGTDRNKILATGVPNFDHISSLKETTYPERDFVLVATSDIRELGGNDDRSHLIRKAVEIADGRKIIFKPHPNEKIRRVISEIYSLIPNATIITDPIIDTLIAHCDTLITQYSSCVYQGLVLGKTVYSYFPIEELESKKPIQNGGKSGEVISNIVRGYLEYQGNKKDFISSSSVAQQYL
jgi:hypothetical protein